MRLFIAINLSDRHRQAIASATAPLRATAPAVTWVATDCLHVTMKFLGEQSDDSVDALRQSLEPVVRRYHTMRLDVGGVGAFPHLRSPRVFWMGMTGEPKLELLHHDLEVACDALGHELDGRAFRPHITLGRVRRELPPRERDLLAAAARDVRYAATLDVRSVDLMRSDLSASGPRYTVLAALPLRGA
jgi:RNA 2',3'-cyclic 3'-phosphodiesterase